MIYLESVQSLEQGNSPGLLEQGKGFESTSLCFLRAELTPGEASRH